MVILVFFIIFWIVILRIFTSRESAEKGYRKIFQLSNDAIFIIDPQKNEILDVNDKACTQLEYTKKELLSLPISAVHPDRFL